MPPVISVEHLSKAYRLGQIGTGTFANDLKVWWAKVRGKPNPLLKIGQEDHGNRDGEIIWALKDVSFTVEQGEVLGVIGRNGAGKSTLLKILSRITAPTEGVVRVKGRIASLLEVGTGFHPELTGRENIYLNGAILGMSRKEIDRKFDEIVAFAEIEPFIDTPVKRYSSGMYVRLAFAVAAHLDAEILLVDEVLAVGDAAFQKKCLGKMGDVASQEGRTVLFVSHNMAAVSNLCSLSILLENGRIVRQGDSEFVIREYLKQVENGDVHNIEQKIETEEFCLEEIRIQQKEAHENLFLTNHPLQIEFHYRVKKETHGLRVGFDLKTQDEIVVFRSFYDDVNLPKESNSPGKYIARCVIPENFLKDSVYYVEPKIGLHNAKWICNGEIRIPVRMQNLSGVNSSYADHRPGVLMPALEWEIEHDHYS